MKDISHQVFVVVLVAMVVIFAGSALLAGPLGLTILQTFSAIMGGFLIIIAFAMLLGIKGIVEEDKEEHNES